MNGALCRLGCPLQPWDLAFTGRSRVPGGHLAPPGLAGTCLVVGAVEVLRGQKDHSLVTTAELSCGASWEKPRVGGS